MRYAVELRSHWLAWVAAALLVGLAGGILVATAAGARRTDSALARYEAAYLFRNARIWACARVANCAPLEHLPQVAAGSIGEEPQFQPLDARGRPLLFGLGMNPYTKFGMGMNLYASIDGNDGVTLDKWKLLSGRLPNRHRASEALLDSRAARTFGVTSGDTIRLRIWRRRFRLKVVGVVASTDPVSNPGGVIRLTPAFYLAHPNRPYVDGFLDVRLKGGAAGFPAFRRLVMRQEGGTIEYDQAEQSSEIQDSIHELAQALWLGVGAGAVLVFLLLAQSLSRMSVAVAGQYPILRAIGMTSRQLLALGIARAATIAVAAAAVSVGVAVALSPLSPIGYARELEPSPGFDVDLLALALGGAAVLVAVTVAGGFAAWRAARGVGASPADGPARVRFAETLARWGLPVPVATGVRLALARRRETRALSAGSALAGVTLAVVITAAALTFSASLHHLFSTPRLFGQNWDYRTDFNQNDWRNSGLAYADREISGLAVGDDKSSVQVNGREVGAWAMYDEKGSLKPTILSGHAPRSHDQVALGTKTMRALGVQIGQRVHVAGPLLHFRPRVVGRVVLPPTYNNQLGEGIYLKPYALFNRLGVGSRAVLLARIRPGADRARTLTQLYRWFGGAVPGLAGPVADFGGVNELPGAISVVLVAVGLAALAQTLVVVVRSRRRDLAILKTLGFDRRQLLATVVCQATTLAAIGLLIGLPIGDALGRWAWNLFAGQLGVVPDAVTPIPLLLLIVPAAITLANFVAIVPARVAARTPPALVLRAE